MQFNINCPPICFLNVAVRLCECCIQTFHDNVVTAFAKPSILTSLKRCGKTLLQPRYDVITTLLQHKIVSWDKPSNIVRKVFTIISMGIISEHSYSVSIGAQISFPVCVPFTAAFNMHISTYRIYR